MFRKKSKMRNKSIDYAKAIAMIMVVCGHFIEMTKIAENVRNSIDFFFYTIHVPTFLFCSGYLFQYTIRKYTYKELLKNKVMNYMGVYLIWGAVLTIINFGVDSLFKYPRGNFFSYILYSFNQVWYFWFLAFCFAFCIIVKLLKIRKWIVAAGIGIAFFITPFFHIGLAKVVTYLIIFLLGYMSGKFLKQVSRVLLICYTVLMSLAYAFDVVSLESVSLGGLETLKVFGIKIIGGMVLVAVFELFGEKNRVLKLLDFLGNNTLYIYILHFIPLAFYRVMRNDSIILYGVSVVGAIAISLFIKKAVYMVGGKWLFFPTEIGMNIKGFIKLFKIFIAGVISLVILSAFSLLYYNNGIRKTSMTGVTDYSWENGWYAVGYEGYALGRYDKAGYNNREIPANGVDVLLMGSSQMNAYNVSNEYSSAYLLSEQLNTGACNYSIYNIGMEGHDFYICSDNLDEALQTYSPTKYVLMETRIPKMSVKSMNEVIAETRVRTPAFDSGLIYYLQKIPYFRLLNRQLRDMGIFSVNGEKDMQEAATETTDYLQTEYSDVVDSYMQKLAGKMKNSQAKLIIFYMPDITVNTDGSITTNGTESDLKMIAQSCKKYDIEFLDLSEAFIQHYADTYEVPFGFSNTAIGTGHLNRCGHAIVADKLCEIILKLEN